MFPYYPDADYAALAVERKRMLERVERLAPLLDAAKPPRSAPADARVETAMARWGRLVRAVRPLRWLLRPAHA